MRPDHHDDAYRAFQAQRWAYEAELEERTGDRRGGILAVREERRNRDGHVPSRLEAPANAQEEFAPAFPLWAAREGKKNRVTCPVCGAKEGELCFVLTDRVFREQSKTHTSQQRVRGPRPQSAKPVPKEQVSDQGLIEKRQGIDKRQAAPASQPRSNPRVLFGGPAKSMDEMRQKRRTDNGV